MKKKNKSKRKKQKKVPQHLQVKWPLLITVILSEMFNRHVLQKYKGLNKMSMLIKLDQRQSEF